LCACSLYWQLWAEALQA